MLASARVRPLASRGSRLLTALAAAGVAAAVVARYGGSAAGWIGGGAAAVLVVLSAIDIEQRRVPNRIVVPAALVALVARVAVDPGRWWVWVAAGCGAAAGFFVLAILRPGGLGMGDVKLVLLVGAVLGGAIVPALLIGTLAAAGWGIVLLARHGREAGCRTIAYVPFLAAGAIVALLVLRP
jgi:leader peptidase (prepilin peptidase)/N-methyltransferase